MPGYDRTGPTGSGPMTGGRKGRCGGMADAPRGGRGQGRGRGDGENQRNRLRCGWRSENRTLAFEEPIRDTRAALEAEAKRLKGELEYVESLIAKSGTETTEG
mgnify:CR=1 FL=1